MTTNDLERANELNQKIKAEEENIIFLRYALNYHIQRRRNPIKRFMMRFIDKDKSKMSLGGEGVSFGGYLMVDMDFLKYAEEYFVKKRDALQQELESI